MAVRELSGGAPLSPAGFVQPEDSLVVSQVQGQLPHAMLRSRSSRAGLGPIPGPWGPGGPHFLLDQVL